MLMVTRRAWLSRITLLGGVGQLAATSGPPAERSPAPDFTLRDSKGGRRRLSDFRGKVVILNFWATWCAPCRAEIPWLIRIHEDFRTSGLEVVGVAMDERGWPAVTPFIRQYRIPYPILLGTPAVARLYGGLETLPRTCFLDRQGRIVASHDAIISEAHLRKIVQVLLADPEAQSSPADQASPR